jgi:DNA-binding transcriptional LysR family regulator
MEIRQIRYFLAAARELNFTRAAVKCNVAQPSLTRAIGLLEAELGGDLFRRERNLTHLTDLGRRMVPLMTRCIENADQASRLAKAIRHSKIVRLNLALRDGIPLEPFVPHLLELSRAFPEFDFRIRRGQPAELEERLKEGAVDILLGPLPDDPWERYEHWPLFQCGFALVVRADHPILGKSVITPEDLSGSTLLHRPDCGIFSQLRDHLEEANVALKPALEFARDDDLQCYLAASHSIAYLPAMGLLRAPLVRRDLQGLDYGIKIHATTVGGRQRGPALGLFLTQLRAADWPAAAATA